VTNENRLGLPAKKSLYGIACLFLTIEWQQRTGIDIKH
jgi:hypothetical protein